MSRVGRVSLPTLCQTRQHAARFAQALRDLHRDARVVVALEGELGAGKTTWVRSLLRALGWNGPVRSPTYTLVEPYEVGGCTYLHIDLYRLGDASELDYLGLREHDVPGTVWLVEWPERGAGVLPPRDVTLRFRHAARGRVLEMTAATPAGRELLQTLGPPTP